MMEHNFRTTVARAPEEVFDFLVDLRNAPQWEPNCQEVEKTSDGPIGKGTTFRAKRGWPGSSRRSSSSSARRISPLETKGAE
jgi:Polyketide cyclase / dehydrase and lipid transport